MSRPLMGGICGIALATAGAAMADEPVQLTRGELDLVTAAYSTGAGWQIGLFTGGQRTIFDPVLLQNGSDSEFQFVGGGDNGASATVEGTATTSVLGNGALTVTEYTGIVLTRGDGNGAVNPAAEATGDYSGTGGTVVPIQNPDGSITYQGVSWAWAYDNPSFNIP